MQWPAGTSSLRGSHCLGNCTTPATSTVVVTFNSVNGSLTAVGAVNSLGLSGTDSRRNLYDSLDAPLYQYSLDPLACAKVYFDFSDISEGFNYNAHFRISIHDGQDTLLNLP